MNMRNNKKMSRFIYVFSILVLFVFTSCNGENSLHRERKLKKQEVVTADEIWEGKIRYLCQTDCKDFDNPHNLKKEYLLKVCQYYKTLSDSNIEYDESIKKYIISSREVSEIVYHLFGIYDFRYESEDCYDKDNGFYFFDDYIGFFDDEKYEYQELVKLDDERFEFNLSTTDGQNGSTKKEKYILKKDENNNYYVASKETAK